MEIAVIGAGICGLTAGFCLGQKGHKVTIFEKKKLVGGLAASFKKKNWPWPLEYYPHHLFASDLAAQQLIQKLGISDKLFFTRPKTSVFLKGKVFRFDSPFSILFSPLFSPLEKVRLSAVTAYLKLTPDWKNLEKSTALEWLNCFYGKKVAQLLWQPLLEGKFGSQADKIAMSWLWARIKKRSPRLGYIQGGFQTLINALVTGIEKNQGQIITGREIKNLRKIRKRFKRTVVTIPTAVLLKLTSRLSQAYQRKAQKLKMIGAVCLILVLKEKFLRDDTYWLNINEKGFPFVFIDEHTNFIDSSHYGNNRLLYIGGYYPQSHRYFKMSGQEIKEEFLPYLKKINPGFDFSINTLDFTLHTDLHAQPIVTAGHSQNILPHQTPIPDVYLANLEQIYPWDRGVNYSIELGEKIAKIVGQ